jgi:hypothetical protein
VLSALGSISGSQGRYGGVVSRNCANILAGRYFLNDSLMVVHYDEIQMGSLKRKHIRLSLSQAFPKNI